ncbi:MAG: hypothetical protein IJX24_00200, partial [Oscillospiraceae bacterium]|nr:hypothetical protein [Oscillospiraceae bacterium]
MKNKDELFRVFKSHFNTKVILSVFVLEFIILTVLFCVAGHLYVKQKGTEATADILTNANAGSAAQYAESIASEKSKSELENIMSKYVVNDPLLVSAVSPSFSAFINHEYNVRNYNHG